jgi:hypothetical protein
MTEHDGKERQGERPEGAKAYTKPRLQVIGDLVSITRTVNKTNKIDDGGNAGHPDKT